MKEYLERGGEMERKESISSLGGCCVYTHFVSVSEWKGYLGLVGMPGNIAYNTPTLTKQVVIQ